MTPQLKSKLKQALVRLTESTGARFLPSNEALDKFISVLEEVIKDKTMWSS